MSETFTASFHNGGMEENGVDSKGRKRKKLRQACREHNIRDPAYCDKQDHIIKGGVHEIWIDIPPKVAYEQIFGDPFREYNGKQTKKARQFDSYYDKVKKSPVLILVHEALVTIGNCEQMPDEETQKAIYKAYVEEFIKQNPNMKVIGAYYHADEMHEDDNGNLVKGAPHIHLDYIPVAYKCNRGQKVQNTMNGALKEQGIVNIEIDAETALKMFGIRDKSRKKKKKVSKENETENIAERMQCLPKLEDKESEAETDQEEKKETRIVTSLVQWTHKQRNLLIKIATEHGLTIENPNEKRKHQSTSDYILSKSENLQGSVYSMAEKLVIGLEELKEDKDELIEWEDNLEGREDSLKQGKEELETEKKEHAKQVKKDNEIRDFKDKISRQKQQEAQEGLKKVEEKEQNHEKAKAHVSERLHKFVKFLKGKKKEIEKKEKQVDQNLNESLEIAKKAENLSDSTASTYYKFADDIKFDDARLMAAKGDGKGLCSWFNGLGHKFGAWLHKAEYFAKHFWNKTPDEIIGVAEDMRSSYCNSLGEYIEKGMKAQTLSQIKATREIKEDVSQVKRKIRSRDNGIEW